jgi:hypothetical protein
MPASLLLLLLLQRADGGMWMAMFPKPELMCCRTCSVPNPSQHNNTFLLLAGVQDWVTLLLLR